MRKYRGKATMSFEKLDELEIKHDNGWVYGNLIDGCYIVGPMLEVEEEYFHTKWWCRVDPKTVGQYIGVHDINGIEIYEGDDIHVKLRRWDKPDEVIADAVVKVEFRDGCFGFEWGEGNVRGFTTFRNFTSTTFEVTGITNDNLNDRQ